MATTFWVKSGASWSENPGGAGNVPATAGVSLVSLYAATQESPAPTDGDTILVSDAHSGIPAGSFTLNNDGSITGSGLEVISVSDTDSTVYSPGAEEDATGLNYNIQMNNRVLLSGVNWISGNDLQVANKNTTFTYQDAEENITGPGDWALFAVADGASIIYRNITVLINSAAAASGVLWVGNGCHFYNYGMKVTKEATPLSYLYKSGGDGGGYTAYNIGCDFTEIETALMTDVFANSADNEIHQYFYKCKLAPGVAFTNDTFVSMGRIEAYECDDSTGDAQYRFHIQDRNGTAVAETTKYRADGAAMSYDGTTKMSVKVTTTANASKHRPFNFVLPASFADLSASASDVAQIYLACANTLDNLDVFATLFYPDGSTEVQCNIISSCPSASGSFAIDPLASGTTLTDDVASDWRDGGGALSGYNEYLIQLDTSGDPGAKGVPRVEISVGKASETIYIGSEVDFV
jgi:hypothetical protein